MLASHANVCSHCLLCIMQNMYNFLQDMGWKFFLFKNRFHAANRAFEDPCPTAFHYFFVAYFYCQTFISSID